MLTAVLDRADTALGRYVPERAVADDGCAPLRGRDGRAAVGRRPGSAHHLGAGRDHLRRPGAGRRARSTSSSTATRRVDGFRLDQDMRWSILIKGAALDLDGAAPTPRSSGGGARSVRPRRPRRAPRGRRVAGSDDEGPGPGTPSTRRLRLGLPDARRDGRLPVAPPARAPRALPRARSSSGCGTSTGRTTTRSRARTCAGSSPTGGREPDVVAQRPRRSSARLDDSEVLLSRQLREVARRPRASDPGARVRVERAATAA